MKVSLPCPNSMQPTPMHKPSATSLRLAAAVAATLFSTHATLHAVAYTWDGGAGGVNTSGDWVADTAFWNPDGVPGTDPADTVTLGAVTSGTRTITLSAAETIAAFTMSQTGAGVVNKFALTNTLTTTTHTFSNVTNANVGTLVLEMGTNGVFTTGGFNFTGTVNFTGAGSSISKFNGGNINLGNGNNGAVTVDVGAGNLATIARTVITNSGHNVAVLGSATNVASLDVKTGTLLISGATSSNFGGSTVALTTGLGATTTVRSGTELKLESGTAVGATNSTTVSSTVNTGGTFNHSGTVSFKNQNNIASGTQTIANNALYVIGSGTASIVRSSGGSTNAASVVTFNNNSGGTFASLGGGASGSLNFINSNGGTGALTRLTFNNLGTIAVGGTATSGLDGVGSLTLTNVNLATSSAIANTMAFQIGGSTAGAFDALTFNSGSLALSSSADTLTLSLVNGFNPVTGVAIPLLNFTNGATKAGEFDFVTGVGGITSAPDVDVSAAFGAGAGTWLLNNDSSTAGFGTITVVPEPGSVVSLLGGLGVLLGLRRPRRRA